MPVISALRRGGKDRMVGDQLASKSSQSVSSRFKTENRNRQTEETEEAETHRESNRDRETEEAETHTEGRIRNKKKSC